MYLKRNNPKVNRITTEHKSTLKGKQQASKHKKDISFQRAKKTFC